MNFQDLRLTEEEMEAIGPDEARGWLDAQLAKALWGVVDWLETYDVFVGDRIGEELEQAGIPRPGGE